MKRMIMLRFGIISICGIGFTGCIVREPPRRRVVIYDAPPPPVEVVPVAPAPDMIFVPGVYVQEGGGYRWHRGYWRYR